MVVSFKGKAREDGMNILLEHDALAWGTFSSSIAAPCMARLSIAPFCGHDVASLNSPSSTHGQSNPR